MIQRITGLAIRIDAMKARCIATFRCIAIQQPLRLRAARFGPRGQIAEDPVGSQTLGGIEFRLMRRHVQQGLVSGTSSALAKCQPTRSSTSSIWRLGPAFSPITR